MLSLDTTPPDTTLDSIQLNFHNTVNKNLLLFKKCYFGNFKKKHFGYFEENIQNVFKNILFASPC